MQASGVFIEYLVTGCLGFIFVFAAELLGAGAIPPDHPVREVDGQTVIAMLPLFMVLGIGVDHIAKKLTLFLSKKSKWINEHSIYKKGKTRLRPAELFLASEELGKQFEMRSTRDRISRGAMLNSIFLIVFYLVVGVIGGYDAGIWLVVLAGLFSSIFFFFVWLRCSRLTDKNLCQASEAIEKMSKGELFVQNVSRTKRGTN